MCSGFFKHILVTKAKIPMLKKAFLTSILVLWALILPLAAHTHDTSRVAAKASKALCISASKDCAYLEKEAHTCPVLQLGNHKPRPFPYSQLLTATFKTFEATLLKLPSLDFEKREVLNALRQGIFLSTRFKRAPPLQSFGTL
jgi:hypothetical protein